MTPTQQILAGAHQTHDVTDSVGRILTIRRPTTLDRLRLFKAAGPSLSTNDRYLGLAMLAFAVTAIDGVPLPQPTNEHQIESALDRLGDDAIDAIGASLHPEDREGLATATPGN